MSLVRHRTSVDLPLPERPITTKTSPGRTSKLTSRTAIVEAVLRRNSAFVSSRSGEPAILASAGPKIFQRPRTAIVASLDAARSGRPVCAVCTRSILGTPRDAGRGPGVGGTG